MNVEIQRVWDEIIEDKTPMIEVWADRQTGKTTNAARLAVRNDANTIIWAFDINEERRIVDLLKKAGCVLKDASDGVSRLTTPLGFEVWVCWRHERLVGRNVPRPVDVVQMERCWWEELRGDELLRAVPDYRRLVIIETPPQWDGGGRVQHPRISCKHYEVRKKTILQTVTEALAEVEDALCPFCELNVKLQDGKVVLVEVLTKHKPKST